MWTPYPPVTLHHRGRIRQVVLSHSRLRSLKAGLDFPFWANYPGPYSRSCVRPSPLLRNDGVCYLCIILTEEVVCQLSLILQVLLFVLFGNKLVG